ncbi:hypothetical protein A3K73_07850 [Candidatus Pacearchaeota archaeon RBG_13_36_9]|nr:MAG: hypothetical protein A3K73_07850 [Candidatus Pacearchaeota archaeon RBG_13_36_9]
MKFGFLSRLFSSSRADKVYNIERAILGELNTRGYNLPLENYDAQDDRFIATPQTSAIYTLLGFDPNSDPSVADGLDSRVENHDSAKSVREEFEEEFMTSCARLFLGSGQNSIVKSDKPYLRTLDPDSPQVLKKIGQYNIRDPELPYLRFNASRRILQDEGTKIFSCVITDIVEPLCMLRKEEQVEYLKELKDIKFEDHPSIICVAASSDLFKRILESRLK